MAVFGSELEQLLESCASLNAAAVVDHVGERAPSPAPPSRTRVEYERMNPLAAVVDIGGRKDEDIEAELVAFDNHFAVHRLLFKLPGVVQIQGKNA
ncbi:hypothetical protein D3C71_1954640 [compost metagenome]